MNDKAVVSIVTRYAFVQVAFIIAVAVSAMHFNSAKILMWFLLTPLICGGVRTSSTSTEGGSDGE